MNPSRVFLYHRLNSEAFELVAIDVLNLDALFRILTVYRPPVSDNDNDSIASHDFKVLIERLQQLTDVDSIDLVNDIGVNINLLLHFDKHILIVLGVFSHRFII